MKIDEHNIETQGEEIPEGVGEYVDRTLEGEDLIEVPMNPDCQIAFVIPLYRERDTILRNLSSLTDQTLPKNEYEVIYVVNREENSLDSIDENSQTIAILSYLGNSEKDLDASIVVSEEEQLELERIKQSGLRVHVIDKSSEGGAYKNNAGGVGVSRDRGVAEAVLRFMQIKRNGVIAHSDGDCRFEFDYAEKAKDLFIDPDLVGVEGAVEFEEIEPLHPRVQEMSSLMHLYASTVDKIFVKRSGVSVEFFGANMLSRAYPTALAGGIPHRKGGEDTAFGKLMAKQGKVIRSEEVLTYPASRPSDRTDKDSGHGQKRIRIIEALEADRLPEIVGLQTACLALPDPRRFIQSVEMHSVTKEDVASLLGDDSDQIEIVLQLFNSDSSDREEQTEFYGIKVKKALADIFPRIYLEEAIDKLIDFYTVDKGIKDSYDRVIQRKYSEVNTIVDEYERSLISVAHISTRVSGDVDEFEHALSLSELDPTIIQVLNNQPEEVSFIASLGDKTEGEVLKEMRERYKVALARPENDVILRNRIKLQTLGELIEST